MGERREHQQRQERQDLPLLSCDREGWFLISQIAFIALIFIRGWKQHLYLQGGEFVLFSLGAVSGDSVAGDSDKPRGLCRAGIYCSLLQSHKSMVDKQSPSHPIPACAGGFLERGDVFPREQRAVEDGQQGPAQERRGEGQGLQRGRRGTCCHWSVSSSVPALKLGVSGDIFGKLFIQQKCSIKAGRTLCGFQMNLLNLSQQKLVPNDFPSRGESPPHPVPGLPAPVGVSGCRASPAAGFICAEMSQKPSNLLLGNAPKRSVGELPTRELPFPIPFLPHFPRAPSTSCPCTA